MTGTVAALAPMLKAPSIEWGQLSPIVLVFAAALARLTRMVACKNAPSAKTKRTPIKAERKRVT